LSASLADMIPLLWEEMERNIAYAGGHSVWQALSADELEEHEHEAYRRVCIHIGEDKFNALTLDEPRHRVSYGYTAGTIFLNRTCTCIHHTRGGYRYILTHFWHSVG
jgi:hypothetical protein